MKLKKIIRNIQSNPNLVTILKSLGAIALITLVATLSVHYLTGQTLSDYAEKNPELAYATPEPEIEAIDPVIDDNSKTGVNASNEATESDINYSDVIDSEENILNTENISNTEDISNTENNSMSNITLDLHISNMIHFYDESTLSESGAQVASRTILEPGFYYEPLSDAVINYITGTSYPTDSDLCEISYEELVYIGILYNDFNDLVQAGEIICNKAIADDLIQIFCELYHSDYRLEKVVLVDNFGGDDTASMSANNTSCFNYREVANTTSLSNHAYGLAIDINPFYNPYIVFGANADGSDYISPSGSEPYVDRSKSFAYKIDENDLCYKLFKAHGFTWGGDWNHSKDYQHFQKKQ